MFRKTNDDNGLRQDRPYLLLTPGPLTTSLAVKEAMLADWCTWDNEYHMIVQQIRKKLVGLAVRNKLAEAGYTCVLMQGSGTFSVEAVIGTVVPEEGRLLIISNGAYGMRMLGIAETLKISHKLMHGSEISIPDMDELENLLKSDASITHIAVVHCETTSGILNPVERIAKLAKACKKILIVDAMSCFGGTELFIDELGIDFLVSSSNKCIQGVPGFGFVIASAEQLSKCEGQARSLSLNLYEQWREMERFSGKWRFTSPTHVVHAFHKALEELESEGGISARYARYSSNQKILAAGMTEMGFKTIVDPKYQSPVITSFYYPDTFAFDFAKFYSDLKSRGFVIYPGKISNTDTFRIGNIGEVYEKDISELLAAVRYALIRQKTEN